jgi:hypothetical protein
MAETIGIKQANGNFYSILEENSPAKKRLILTTVHNSQKSVQIDLYRSVKKTMDDAAYIGSIVVENIGEKPKGEPSIELILSSTMDGSISAYATDLANSENKHQLSISLKSLEKDNNEYPDFDIETLKKNGTIPETSGRKFPWLVIIIIGLVLVLLCLGLWFFLFRNMNTRLQQTASAAQPAASALANPEPHSAVQAPANEPKAEQKPPLVIEIPPAPQMQPRERDRAPAPVYSFTVPQTIPPEGITYMIRWGDTLWDISEAFYRNPRFYPFIVRSNNIRNPNHIVSGTAIGILPRN